MALYLLRYGSMRLHENFKSDENYKPGDEVIVRTERGVEIATVLNEIPTDKDHTAPKGTIMRRANESDLRRIAEIQKATGPEEMVRASQFIEKHKLDMKIVFVEHILGGEKVIFYFRANGRVDFRDLVRDLAHEFNTRIELKQIGSRDEAKLLASYSHCGQQICCCTFLTSMQPVSMKMAKNQKATLDPAKISGRCGRLMCCLRYEDSLYEEMKKTLPRKNYMVETPQGVGEVVNLDVLGQMVTIRFEGGRFEIVAPDQIIKSLGKAKKRPRRTDPEPQDKNQQNKPRQDRPGKKPKPGKPCGQCKSPGKDQNKPCGCPAKADPAQQKKSEQPKTESKDDTPEKTDG